MHFMVVKYGRKLTHFQYFLNGVLHQWTIFHPMKKVSTITKFYTKEPGNCLLGKCKLNGSARPERLIKIISTRYFLVIKEINKYLVSRYDFDQLFPVGRSCAYNQFGVLHTRFGEMGYLFSWTSPVSVLSR
jgi:hypothetical protein